MSDIAINVYFGTMSGSVQRSGKVRLYDFTPSSLKRLARIVRLDPRWTTWPYFDGWLALWHDNGNDALPDEPTF